MEKKIAKKKLTLNKETIRTLRDMELENIVAGSSPGGTGPCPTSLAVVAYHPIEWNIVPYEYEYIYAALLGY